MAERKLTNKGLIKKIANAKSAIGFIAQYREYLMTEELAPICGPIIVRLDANELLPTPALNEIGRAVVAHVMAKDAAKINETAKPNKHEPKNWIATIYDSKNDVQTRINNKGEIEQLIKEFNASGDATRWCDARLFDGAPDWFATIEHTHSQTKEIILRNDAMARVIGHKKSAASSRKSQSTGSLGFGTHAKQSKVSFSRG